MAQNKNITSFQNPSVKRAVALRERKTRDQENLIIVEGFREVMRAKEAKLIFKELFVCPGLFHHEDTHKLVKELVAQDIDIFEVPEAVSKKISYGERQEGILAVCQKPKRTLGDLKLSKNPLLVVAEGIEKPGNLGAILRSCDGAGVDAVLLADSVTDSFNPNVVRASVGTIFSLPVIECSKEAAFRFLQDNKVKIFASTPQAKTVYTDADFKIPSAVVVGSEEKGLSRFWVDQAEAQIKIPMQGKADSLNVSITAAIIIYEAIRQRTGKK